jgi:allantoicase
MSESHLLDLASARLGGAAVEANDEFFAEKENLLKPEAAVFVAGRYTDRGKWMDGWETRRRRTPGHDWCIVRLGLPGVIHSITIDTAFFTGNYPSHCWVDACGLPAGADARAADVAWHPLLARHELAGNTANVFAIDHTVARRFTHVRLNIFPDGGVARLRVFGDALPDWTRILAADGDVDLAAVVHGGYVVDMSDRFYGEPHNMLMPHTAANMGDGWETKRRRGPGHDWAVVRLGMRGAIRRVEIDTAHFKGNYPGSASVEAAVVPEAAHGGVSADSATRGIADWKPVLPETPLQPDHLHAFDVDTLQQRDATHVRLNIFPDGGVSRFRVFGSPSPGARGAAVVRLLNAMDVPELSAALSGVCAAPAWIDRVAAARPYASANALRHTAEAALDGVDEAGWHEALRHHPRIGERQAERSQSPASAAASAREQAGVGGASTAEREALDAANREYEQKFGHVFLVSAAGKSAGDIVQSLRARMGNDPATELRVAAEEHKKITRARLERLLG